MTSFMMEAANGMLVSVEGKDLKAWEEQQHAVKEGRFQPSEGVTEELRKLLEGYRESGKTNLSGLK